ncbi:MAG: hypothetical protein QM499_11825 [Flavobacteriaceae bacterium]
MNKKERILIEKELSDLVIKVNEIKTHIYVITFPLTKEINPERIKHLNNKMELNNSKYGIFVLFTTNYDHAGFRLPKEIKGFYQIVGGEFDCSMIIIEKDK